MSKIEKPNHLLTVDAVAERLVVHVRTVRRKIADGELVAHRFGRALRVSPADLDDYVKRNRASGPRVR